MTTPEVEKQWYQALWEEDCLWVRELLLPEKHWGLLKLGWKGDPNLLMQKSPDTYWKGRTAVHVGARRGDLQLIKQVLKLCGLKVDEKVDEQGPGSSPVPKLSGLKVDEKGKWKVDEKGKWKVDEQFPGSSPDADTRGDGIEDNVRQSAQVESNGAEGKGKDVDEGTSSSEGKKVDDFAPSEGDEKSKRDSTQALENYKRSLPSLSYARSRRMNREASAGLSDFFVSKSELRELLLSKDGQYELDALAMATLHGNIDITVLLVYALGECDHPPYLIGKTEGFSPQALVGIDREQRIELREVTKKVIDWFRREEPAFMAACEEEYRRYRDFNFLPLEEYLFHFSWTARFEEVFHELHKDLLRIKLWRTVRRWPDQEETDDDEEKPQVQEKLDEHAKPTAQERRDEQKSHNELWPFLLKLHDGQGRPPFHLAVDEGTEIDFLLLLGEKFNRQTSHYWFATKDWYDKSKGREAIACAATALDGSGTSPLYRAAAITGDRVSDDSTIFWDMVNRVDGVSAAYREKREHPITKALLARKVSWFALDKLSEANGFRRVFHGSTPLQAAIIHNNFGIGKFLFRHSPKKAWKMLYRFDINPSRWEPLGVNVMELVCFVGAKVDWVRLLLKAGYLENSKGNKPAGDQRCYLHLWPILHLVATYGHYQALQLFLDDRFCDRFAEDVQENTPLHCVMRDAVSVSHLYRSELTTSPELKQILKSIESDTSTIEFREVEFKTHLLDYVSCQHLLSKDQRTVKKILHENFLADRKGCVNLLLQAGCDIFKINIHKEVPYPQGRLSSDTKFLEWWYEKQAKEFASIQNGLHSAANAISVIATLVATASFVGPLQPPRSYTEDNQVDYENGWVATFVFCDTFSFYLAIVAIVLSLIPFLPVPQQAMFDELRRTRMMITLAVGVLFPSIISVLIAFASGSMAVVTPGITSELGRNLALASMFIGGLLILAAFFFLTVRLLGTCFPRNSWIRYMYELTSF